MQKLPLPPKLKLEALPRRTQYAVFDRIDLVVEFRPGRDGIGATVKGFIDAIAKHDAIVQKYEEVLNHSEELRRNYRKRNRLFRNLDSAWNVLMTNPVEFAEYQELLPKMKNIDNRITMVSDPEIKAKLITQKQRFDVLQPNCSKQMVIYGAYSEARKERDKAAQELVEQEHILRKLREDEKVLASLISDDHILADEMKKTLTKLFANVHVGYILTNINGDSSVETLPFAEVMQRLARARSPHKVDFKRYDYRYNPFNSTWLSLQELRDQGVTIEDPLLQRLSFISLAGQGDRASVQELLKQGEDPNGTDLTGNTALVAAAVNQHQEIVTLLMKAGADVNSRDKNMMTPLLYVINRGDIEMVRLLLDVGADKSAMDHNLRGTVYYAILSGNIKLVKLFLKKEKLNVTDRLWGFTALHVASNLGLLDICNFLIEYGVSIYRLDKQMRTAEQVAKESGHVKVVQRLEEERLQAPAQLIFSCFNNLLQYWIGDSEALEATYCTDIEFTHILYFIQLQEQPPISAALVSTKRAAAQQQQQQAEQQQYILPKHTLWLKKDPHIEFITLPVAVLAEDGDVHSNWDAVYGHVLEVMEHIEMAIQTARSLILANVSATSSLTGGGSSVVSGAGGSQLLIGRSASIDDDNQSITTANSSSLVSSTSKIPPVTILICDDTGSSLAPTMMAIVLLLKQHIRIKDSLKLIRDLRPRVEISPRMLKGLDHLQQTMDAKVLHRMNKKTKGSMATSVAF